MMDTIRKLLNKTGTAIFLSIFLGFSFGALVLALAGYNPIEAYAVLFKGIFGRPRYMVQTIIAATPIIITGISVTFAYKTGLFNIGADGQFMVGAVAAACVGYFVKLPPIIHPIAVILAAMAAAGIYGGFVGHLKAKYGINEVLTSIMLNWIAIYFNNFYITLPGVKKPGAEASYEIQQTAYINVLNNLKSTPEGIEKIRENPFWADIIIRTDINYGIIIAIICAVAVWFILEKTTLGYSLKAVGSNKDAAEFAGINVRKNITLSMFISGAIAGLAGAVYIMGMMPHRVIVLAMSENYGFNGLSVALLANLNPIGCIFSGLLFGGLKYGGGSIQTELGAPSEIINIMIGVIVLFISMNTIFKMISDWTKKRGKFNED
ncbi:ABC transporter permease [Anaeropeptidivorans aminofermentans]|uniref:ABC transporter permease n=1 Tax=Anaeropeptidivorans aminofermentans TaxID=2934315 RepID=UPI002B1F1C83|nr:ABC transporter permease [Anaeropeptidivorans aminofermentans]